MVGVAMPFSIASRKAKGQGFWKLLGHAGWRALVLIVLGIFLRSIHHQHSYFTFEDTLTQIGLGYVFLFVLAFTRVRTQVIVTILILIASLIAAGVFVVTACVLAYRLLSGREQANSIRLALTWLSKGLLLPLIVWTVMNLGISWNLQPFMPQVQAT